MADKPATPIKVTWLIGALAAFVVFALIAGYSRQMTYVYTDYSQQRAAERLKTLVKLQADENQQLATLDWIDQSKKTIRIPIDTAMDREIATLLLKPAAISTSIPGAAPAPAPVVPPSTNAAPVKPKAPAKPKQ